MDRAARLETAEIEAQVKVQKALVDFLGEVLVSRGLQGDALGAEATEALSTMVEILVQALVREDAATAEPGRHPLAFGRHPAAIGLRLKLLNLAAQARLFDCA